MDEDSISMYLSFESSNSTMSTTAAYKTLTDLSGVSALETMDVNEVDLSSHLNRTLEAGDKSKGPTQMQMLIEKKFEDISMKIHGHSPLRPFTKNIMQEYRAMCSTPTKEQLMRTVDVTRGSEAAPCADLGAAFSHFDDDKSKNMTAHAASTIIDEDCKENTQPESGDGSTMSSSVEIVSSIIERKAVNFGNSLKESTEAKLDIDEEATPKANCVVAEVPEEKSDQQCVGGEKKQRRSLMPPKVRYSKYQPNFLGMPSPSRQRPTSILKPSLLANRADPAFTGNEEQVSAEIPKLLSQMLQITSAVKENSEKSTVRMLNAIKGRASMLPSALEKRPYNFTSRMSTVVKTTLNSPARKIARRSVMPPAARPSVAGTSQLPKPSMSRKSMLPVNNATAKNPAFAGKRPAAGKEPEAASRPVAAPPKSARLETTYTCSQCSAKFRVKSLLDAHKRSHETDTPVQQKASAARPSIMTASSSSAASSMGSGTNQCKYCDKKFALVRALHIHLMQNCPKIPPGEKKKLQFTELDHVEKAQLPFHTEGPTPLSSQRSKSASKALLLGSMESLNGKKDLTKSTAKTHLAAPASTSKTPMAAPSSASGVPVRMKTAHSGIYRTPTKTVKCKQCKLSFKSIMEHIDHNLKMHPRAAAADGQNAGGGDTDKL